MRMSRVWIASIACFRLIVAEAEVDLSKTFVQDKGELVPFENALERQGANLVSEKGSTVVKMRSGKAIKLNTSADLIQVRDQFWPTKKEVKMEFQKVDANAAIFIGKESFPGITIDKDGNGSGVIYLEPASYILSLHKNSTKVASKNFKVDKDMSLLCKGKSEHFDCK